MIPHDPNKKDALILMSGGLDSTTAAAIRAEEFNLFGLIFGYGQEHSIEVQYAFTQARKYCHAYTYETVNLKGMSPLTGLGDIPTDGESKGIAPTWVPGRNMIFLSIAAAFAHMYGCERIIIGVNTVDFSGYPDCRGEFLESMEKTINLALGNETGYEEGWLKIDTPLLNDPKKTIVQLALAYGIDLNETWSCYVGKDEPCGECDSCRIREKAIMEAMADEGQRNI